MCASVAELASMTVLSKAENPGVHQSEYVRIHFYGRPSILEKLPYLFPPFHFPPPKMPDPAPSRASSPSTSSSDDEEYSSFPISKREYLLAQLKQKDAIIESLLKQVCLFRVLSTNLRPQLTMIGDPVPLLPAPQPISRYPSLDRSVPYGNIFG
jgi:hypothetical protein